MGKQQKTTIYFKNMDKTHVCKAVEEDWGIDTGHETWATLIRSLMAGICTPQQWEHHLTLEVDLGPHSKSSGSSVKSPWGKISIFRQARLKQGDCHVFSFLAFNPPMSWVTDFWAILTFFFQLLCDFTCSYIFYLEHYQYKWSLLMCDHLPGSI